MELTPATVATYVDEALDGLLAVAEQLGEDLLNQRPHGPQTNSVGALVVHCCGVVEFWLGHVALGRPTDRDRESEFLATPTLAELRELVARTQTQVRADLQVLERGGAASAYATADDPRQFLAGGDRSDASLALHLVEELFQHLGHAELTADALR